MSNYLGLQAEQYRFGMERIHFLGCAVEHVLLGRSRAEEIGRKSLRRLGCGPQ
jgi:hypothetical protein